MTRYSLLAHAFDPASALICFMLASSGISTRWLYTVTSIFSKASSKFIVTFDSAITSRHLFLLYQRLTVIDYSSDCEAAFSLLIRSDACTWPIKSGLYHIASTTISPITNLAVHPKIVAFYWATNFPYYRRTLLAVGDDPGMVDDRSL